MLCPLAEEVDLFPTPYACGGSRESPVIRYPLDVTPGVMSKVSSRKRSPPKWSGYPRSMPGRFGFNIFRLGSGTGVTLEPLDLPDAWVGRVAGLYPLVDPVAVDPQESEMEEAVTAPRKINIGCARNLNRSSYTASNTLLHV